MKRAKLAVLAAVAASTLGLFVGDLAAANFTYTQTDATTGAGVIAPFIIGSAGGDINFAATPLPSAVVINPGPGQFVGLQTVAAGNSNESNGAIGLTWSGFVTATGTRGTDIYTVQIPLKFVPKVTQSPDINDYTWNVIFGDNSVGGQDTVSTASPRFGMWYSRDDVIDALETANTFQRYTQQNNAFVVGQDVLTNTDLTTTAIKDATDSGNPAGVDAAGRDLAFYFGWRDQGTMTPVPPVFTVDTFTVGGMLNPDPATLIPEPGSLLALAGAAMLGMMRRRRA
ncbi:MAG TPA: PEP-CTERM sorting domain-containing protein [Tepidisphaeraceae bacterium]|jgi:hypothetical protein|nr:PEP-CTERM sorting domain-containing protein [Tepidisphaeraceae bacterium]